MKKMLLAVVVIILMAGAYLLGTFNGGRVVNVPPMAWTENSEAAQSWRELIASMEAAGAKVFASTDDSRERLEGLLYLSQLVSVSLEMKLAKGSQSAPQFTDWMGSYRKFLGDSPDAVYHTAEISPDYSYEISGNIADAEYLGFMLYGTALNGWNRAAGNISTESLSLDGDGIFRIVLSKNEPAEAGVDWLPLEDDIHMVMVRQYFHDRPNKHEAVFTIHSLNAPEFLASTDAELVKSMDDATAFFNETMDGSVALIAMLSANTNNIDPPKSYSQDFGGVFYPTSDNEYFGTWFRLADDEAMVIEAAVPDAPYWSVSLQNRWMQSMDYQHFPVSLNDQQIATGNSRYQIILSHQKPPSGNWLSTAGSNEGLLSIRYQLSSGNEKPSLRVVKFDQL